MRFSRDGTCLRFHQKDSDFCRVTSPAGDIPHPKMLLERLRPGQCFPSQAKRIQAVFPPVPRMACQHKSMNSVTPSQLSMLFVLLSWNLSRHPCSINLFFLSSLCKFPKAFLSPPQFVHRMARTAPPLCSCFSSSFAIRELLSTIFLIEMDSRVMADRDFAPLLSGLLLISSRLPLRTTVFPRSMLPASGAPLAS